MDKKPLTPETCPLEPMEDNLIVKRLRAEKTAGGILLPENAGKGRFAARAEVLAVGPGSYDNGKYEPLPVNPGDHILFSNQAGLELTDVLRQELLQYGVSDDDAKDIILLRYVDVVAKIKS